MTTPGAISNGAIKTSPCGFPIELKTVTGFKSHVDPCHEIFQGFQHSLGVRVANVLVLEELLANPTQGTSLGGPRLVGTKSRRTARARARQKPQQGAERVAILVHTGGAVEEVVWIICIDAPANFAARPYVALGSCGPSAKLEILVGEELRGSPDRIDAEERVVPQGFWIAVSHYPSAKPGLMATPLTVTFRSLRAWRI
jgi:hypothetical protein